jgi:mannose-6-phosphate isomerase-like protein (cupin superfamily)
MKHNIGGDKKVTNYKEERPWGSFEILADRPNYKTKILTVLPGKRLSLQAHQKREENWIVVSGKAQVQIDDEFIELDRGEHVYIPKTAKHRLENRGSEELTIIEVQTGEYFGEDDIVRYEDDFNRASI